MDLFIDIHERNKDLDMELSVATIETYKEKDITDPDGTVHLCIVYIINNGLRFEEEFDNVSDREAKMNELADYTSSGGEPPVLIDKNISANGTYNASSDNADGYKKVVVDVQNDCFVTPLKESNYQANALIRKFPSVVDCNKRVETSNMFLGCRNLIELKLKNADKTTNLTNMFMNCVSLQLLDIRDMVITSDTSGYYTLLGSNSSNRVPYSCVIVVKDQATKELFNTGYFSNYTNVVTAEEYDNQ